MGFSSFKTIEGKSISNAFSTRGAFKVYMVDDKNNKYIENAYQGYCEFGGKDYFVLLYEMNTGKSVDQENEREHESARQKGISIFYSDDKHIKYPMLTTNKHREWENKKTESCKYQGYFYDGFKM